MKKASAEAGATIMKTKSSKARAGAMFMKIRATEQSIFTTVPQPRLFHMPCMTSTWFPLRINIFWAPVVG